MDSIGDYKSDSDNDSLLPSTASLSVNAPSSLSVDQTINAPRDQSLRGDAVDCVEHSADALSRSGNGLEEQEERDIQQVQDLKEIQQKVAWNEFIPLKSHDALQEIEGVVDEIQVKSIEKLAILRSKGLHFNDQLLSTKAFKNPCIMDKMLDYHNVDVYGTFLFSDLAFKDEFKALQQQQVKTQSSGKLSSEKESMQKKSIEFVKSSHKSNYYDKRRRI